MDRPFLNWLRIGVLGLFALPAAASAQTISVTPGTTLQTITGWEAVAVVQNLSSFSPTQLNALADGAVNDVGITRVRLEVRSGAENTVDTYATWKNASFPTSGSAYTSWRCNRYVTGNDNGDPNSINAAGFHFSELDYYVDKLVNPMRQKMAAPGEHLYVNLNYVAFTSQIKCGGQYIHDNTAEYAEFILAVFQHMQSKYGWVPDAVEVILEPDNVSQWNASKGTLIGQAIVAAGNKLKANGFTPDFIAPSNTSMANAVTYFDNLIRVSGVKSYLKEIAYHRYSGVSAGSLQAIADRGVQHGLDTAMLEWWNGNNTYKTLHEDLQVGRNSAWEQGTLSEVKAQNGPIYEQVGSTFTLGAKTKFYRQYYKYVRPGAVRVGATSGNSAFDPLAFKNIDGKYVVVVKANGGGSFTIGGLPAGTYGIFYTTSSQYDMKLSDQAIAAGATISMSIPAAGVLTVHAKTSGGGTGGTPPPTTPPPD